MSSTGSPQYAVNLRSRRVQKELDAVHESDYRRIITALRSLGDRPRPDGCEKLYDNVYRVRVGVWRIIYLVDDGRHTIEVGGIRRRSERTYKGIDDIFR